MQSQRISEPSQLVEESLPPPADHNHPSLQLSPCRAVYLPPELTQKIFQSCDKTTLKSVRLICSDWNHAVIPLLFDRVFVSAREKDLEVFQCITEREHLAANVKALHVDATGAYPTLDQALYNWDLTGQLVRLLDRFPLSSFDSEPLKIIQLQTLGYRIFFRITQTPNPSGCCGQVEFHAVKENEDMEATPDGFEQVVRESHAEYIAMAEAEYEVLRNEVGLTSKLQFGVKRLERLQTVIIDDGIWEINPEERFPTFDPGLWYGYGSGSPAARFRNPMHLYPSPYAPNDQLAANLFWAVASALAVSSRRLKGFRNSSNRGAGFVPRSSKCRPSDYWCYTDAFSALEYLELNIRHPLVYGVPREAIATNITSLLCRNQSSLRQLTLEFGGYRLKHPTITGKSVIKAYTFQGIFKKCLHMPNLVTLSLARVAIRAYELVNFLRLHCPKLKELAIGSIDLEYGNWQGLLTMFKGLKLDHFHMSSDAKYWQRPDQILGSHEVHSGVPHEPEKLIIPESMDYVLGAVTHPCYQEYVWKGDLRAYHRKVMSAIVCSWPEGMRKSVIDDYHAAIGTIQVPLESRLNLDWSAMGLTKLLPLPDDSPGQTIKNFMLRNT